MHESGIIQSILNKALATARQHDSALRGLDIRLGALAGGTAEHIRDHLTVEMARRRLTGICVTIAEDADFLGGVELVSVDLAKPDEA